MRTAGLADRTVVFDVGKTNLKLSLVDAHGQVLREMRRANQVDTHGPYTHFDVDAVWQWLLGELAALPERERIDAIFTTTHGASAALVDAHGLVLPVLDYEFAGVREFDAEYGALRDDFAQTLSPPLGLGLNLARQLHWQQKRFPAQFARARWILPYPEYWGWRLSGVAAAECTSWGSHSDLWLPISQTPSALAQRLHWQRLLPPMLTPGDTLGPLLPAIAQHTGLSQACRVLCGIHDNNASMAKHLWPGPRQNLTPVKPFCVVSSGTWIVLAAFGAPLSVLDPAADMLGNVDAWARPYASARFMGGREFAKLCPAQDAACSLDDVQSLIHAGAMALPSFAESGGAYEGQTGSIVGESTLVTPQLRYALASLYCALMTDDALSRLGGQGDTVIEGSLTANAAFAAVLAQLRGTQAVYLSDDRSGTTGGAYLLARKPDRWTPTRRRALAPGLVGLQDYRSAWRKAVGSRAR